MTWLDVIERLYPIVAGLLGVGLFEIVKFFFFAKSDKKGKDIENKSKEIDNKGKTIDNEHKEIDEYSKIVDKLQETIKKQSDYYESRIDGLEKSFAEYEKNVNIKVSQFKARFDKLEFELKTYKEAVLEAHRCKLPVKLDDCPVISKLKLLANECTDCQHNKHND